MATLFYGALVSPRSLREHYTSPHAVVCVSNASGNIEWVEHDVPASAFQDVLAQHGLVDLQAVDVVELKHGEFLMPGFIDTHLVSACRHMRKWHQYSLHIHVASLSSTECRKVCAVRNINSNGSDAATVDRSTSFWTGSHIIPSLWKRGSRTKTLRSECTRRSYGE